MMVGQRFRRKTRRIPLVPKRHVKYEGILAATLHRYRRQIRRFFDYLHDNGFELPQDLETLDDLVSDYIDHIYQDDYPINFGNDLVSGLKRLYPRCRRHLEISSSFMRNWTKALHRNRALPLPKDLLLAMAAAALLKGKPRLSLALLIGFLGLLRTGEILALNKAMLSVHGDGSLLVITLPETKSGHRRGECEHVLIYDKAIIQFCGRLLRTMDDKESLLGMKFRQLAYNITELAGFFGCSDRSLTPYCIRRGGATWHFTTYQNYDSTQALGRWSSAKTARLYINQATSEIGFLNLPEWGRDRVRRGVASLTALMQES